MKWVSRHGRFALASGWPWLAAVTLAVCMAAWLPGAHAQDARPARSTVLIFDGSGSMWGKIDGERQIKLAMARDAVKLALGKLPGQPIQLGLMSYGHRRQADCSDVQLITPPEPSTPDEINQRIVAPLEKLNPKGKGPLTAALKEAAKQLAKAQGPRSIILIHDDPDNCQQDPCAALAEMQQAAPGVVVHVVGLGLKPEDSARYQCLTKPTGGRHVDAHDAAQIAAGIGQAMQTALLGGAESTPTLATVAPQTKAAPTLAKASPQSPVAPAPAAPAIELAEEGPPAIRLRALVGKERFSAGIKVRWTVTPDPARDGLAATDADGADTVLPMPSGSYKVRAVSGLVQAETTVTVGAKGQTLAQVAFDAGEIRINAPLAADATVIVAERATTAAAPLTAAKSASTETILGRRLGVWPHGQTSLLVPARPIVLSLEQAELRSAWPIELTPGQVRELDVGQAGGRVTLDLLVSVGGPQAASLPFANQAVVFTLEEDDPDAPNGRREIARSASPVAEFVVAPGTYVIAASRGPLETRDRINVVAGEIVRRSLPLAASRLVLGAKFGKSASLPTDRPEDSFVVSKIDADRETPFLLQGPAAVVDVPPGRYRVEARRNNAAIRAEQVVEIRAGEFKAVTLEYQAGALRVDMTDAVSPGDQVTWRIVDAAGRLVESGDEIVATTLLPAGRYTLKAESRGKRREVAVEIRTGEINGIRLQ